LSARRESSAWAAIAWLIFPAVPVLIARSYHDTLNISRTDPRQWDLGQFLILLGPPAGYAYLAGATACLPDGVERRGWRGWLARRAFWVGVGPWVGFLIGALVLFTSSVVDWLLRKLLSGQRVDAINRALTPEWTNSTTVGLCVFAFLAYAWLAFALAASRRAWRTGRVRKSLGWGLSVTVAFLGSLLGGFWAVTSTFRSFFFDPRVLKVAVVASLSVGLIAGCSPPPTAGDMRRRELFQAMLMAWVLGLALIWRWLSRPRAR
jgi:hypothetical protein